MRIVTWNVLAFTGYPPQTAAEVLGAPGTEPHLAHYAGVLDGFGADIIGLQEGVAHGRACEMAQRAGYRLATFPSPQHWPGHVLSRGPIVESRIFSHAAADDSLPPFSRTAGAARLQVTADRQLWVVCVHLHPGDVELRVCEGELLRQRLAELLPVCEHAVVLGDFNCEVDEPVHGHLRDLGFVNAMEAAGGGLQLTMDTDGIRPHIIDHIYLSPEPAAALTDAGVVRGAGFRTEPPRPAGVWDASDHLPVRADLEWP